MDIHAVLFAAKLESQNFCISNTVLLKHVVLAAAKSSFCRQITFTVSGLAMELALCYASFIVPRNSSNLSSESGRLNR